MYTLLYGALKNTGDFLIYERAKGLLRRHKGMGEYVEFHSVRDSLDPHLGRVNSTKAVIICGGPGILSNTYPGKYPLATNLDDIKVPVIIMGSGWYGTPGDDATLTQYRFDVSTKRLFERINRQGHMIGVRDYLTQRVLRENGVDGVIMTGCPSWYDLAYLDHEFQVPDSIKTVAFTPPAKPLFTRQAIDVMRMLKELFPDVRLICSFHRGLAPDEHTTEKEARPLEEMAMAARGLGFEVVDSSYGLENVGIYDECDLHVGYRVHGHILFLSKRKPSLLIHEDGRGRGVSEALGLPGVQGWERTALGVVAAKLGQPRLSAQLERRGLAIAARPSTVAQLERYIRQELESGFARFSGLAQTFRQHYRSMVRFLDTVP